MIGKMRSKKDNIAEYILYLWQMEDYLRAFPQHAEATEELHELNEMMHREGIMDGGHLAIANNALEELEELHATLLNEDAMYLYQVMLLRLQKKEISLETTSVQQQATRVLTFLSKTYHDDQTAV